MSDDYDPILDDLRLICDRPMYRDRDGEPITLRQWGERIEAGDTIVAKTVTRAGEVSTVWLGVDHAILGPPQIFETMVFETELSWSPIIGDYHEAVDVEMRRYATEEEALRGHLEVVEALGGPVVPDAS